MKLIFRKPDANKDDYELIFGVLIIPLCFLVALAVTRLPADWAPYCVMRRVTEVPCPACGTFRSASLLSHGQLVDAWITQPLMTAVIILALLYMFYSLIVVPFRLPRPRLEGKSKRIGLVLVVLLVVAAMTNWVYLLVQAR